MLIQAPTGSGKTLAAFLIGIDRLNATPGEGLRLLYVSPLKALNYDIERNLRSPLAGLESELSVAVRTGDTPADERRRMLQDAARHPHHDPGVALPAPHLAGARDAARGRDRDPRRGARGRRERSGAAISRFARAAGGTPRQAVPAHRALCDAAPARRDRPLRRRHAPRHRARRRGRAQGARPRGRDPGRGPARARLDGRPLGAAARGRRAHTPGVEQSSRSIWPSIYPRDPRSRPRTPLHDRLRQQPPPRGAARAAAERARGGGDRPRAPRLARARAALSSSRSC